MFGGFFLLFFLNGGTGFTVAPFASTPYQASTAPMTTEEKLSSLELVATPDYPVTAGQTVHLRCSAFSYPKSVVWSWQHMMKNQTWREVGSEMDLTLSKPEQSGVYRCRARSLSAPWRESPNHTVFIIAAHPTVGENLGIAAFAFVLLLLILNLAVLSWMGLQKFGNKPNNSITPAKGFPGPEKSPKGGLQQTDTDGDVYMNYTSTNRAYSDLDPASMTNDNVYSSLS